MTCCCHSMGVLWEEKFLYSWACLASVLTRQLPPLHCALAQFSPFMTADFSVLINRICFRHLLSQFTSSRVQFWSILICLLIISIHTAKFGFWNHWSAKLQIQLNEDPTNLVWASEIWTKENSGGKKTSVLVECFASSYSIFLELWQWFGFQYVAERK